MSRSTSSSDERHGPTTRYLRGSPAFLLCMLRLQRPDAGVGDSRLARGSATPVHGTLVAGGCGPAFGVVANGDTHCPHVHGPS